MCSRTLIDANKCTCAVVAEQQLAAWVEYEYRIC
jgi:hypothetical protein